MAESHEKLLQNPQELDRIIDVISPQVGQRILELLDFPPSLIKVPANFLNLGYLSEGDADYVDIVLVAGTPRVPDELRSHTRYNSVVSNTLVCQTRR